MWPVWMDVQQAMNHSVSLKLIVNELIYFVDLSQYKAEYQLLNSIMYIFVATYL
jgi:hypothetical protein